MGEGASATLGFRRPELFDFVGVMGGPLADATSFGRMLIRGWMGGFCELSELEAMMAEGHDLDDESAFCGLYTDRARQDIQATEMAVPREYLPADQAPLLESVSDYNNWWRGRTAAGVVAFTRQTLQLLRGYFEVIRQRTLSFQSGCSVGGARGHKNLARSKS